MQYTGGEKGDKLGIYLQRNLRGYNVHKVGEGGMLLVSANM
jgi:hypothetical protein